MTNSCIREKIRGRLVFKLFSELNTEFTEKKLCVLCALRGEMLFGFPSPYLHSSVFICVYLC